MSYSGYGSYDLSGTELHVGKNGDGTVTLAANNEDHVNGGSPLNNFFVGAAGYNGSFYGVGGNGYGYTFDVVFGDPSFADGTGGHSANISVGVWSPTSYGFLSLTNGARMTSVSTQGYDAGSYSNTGGYYNINIGRGGGYGTVVVDGAGSFLGASGFAPRITLGTDSGSGQLTISNGGGVGAQSVIIGRREGTGQVTVNGAGSVLNVSSDYGQYGTYNGNDYSGAGGSIQIGRQGGGGQLNIFGGGVVNVENTDGVTDGARVVVGRDGGNGNINVSGAGSQLNIIQHGAVGDDDSNGARLQLGVSPAGEGNAFVSSDGVINVLGDQATILVGANHDNSANSAIPNSLSIGYGGVVNVNSQNGTHAAKVEVGMGGNDGFVYVGGPGSQLNIESSTVSPNGFAAHMTLGHYGGTGSLYVAGGGKVKIDGGGGRFPNLTLGLYDGNGQVTVTGAGSAIDLYGTNTSGPGAGGALMVGGTASTHHGNGYMRIMDGGSVTLHSANSIMGIALEHGGSNGMVEVTGAGSSLNVGGTLAVGGGASLVPDTDGMGVLNFDPGSTGGNAALIVTDGATLNAGEILIGQGAMVDLSGNIGGNLHNHGFLTFGQNSSATMNLTGDFNLENGQAALLFSIADFNGGTGDMFTVTGDAHINFRKTILALNIDPSTDFGIGARYTMGSVGGHLDFKETVVYDQMSGAAFRAFATGAGLVRLESLTGLFNGFAYEDRTNDTNAGNVLTGDGMDNYINGRGGADTLSGDSGGDVLLGGGGGDTLNGDDGRDLLIGGGGDDVMNGGRGNDQMDGGTGVDTMHGDDHADTLLGGGGGDTLFGDNGNDNLDGEGGADTLHGGNGDDTLRGGGGNDVLNGDSNNDTLFGEADHDTLNGGGGDDLLFGNDGNDTLNGDGGDDTLNGGAGVDILDGGSQSDILIGGADADTMTGGSGGDIFRFFDAGDIGTNSGNRDVITDFQHNLDLIDLSGIDANSNTGDDDFFTFIGTSSFSGTAGELRRTNSGGDKLVQGDVDGDGVADFRLEISGGVSVTESDFIL